MKPQQREPDDVNDSGALFARNGVHSIPAARMETACPCGIRRADFCSDLPFLRAVTLAASGDVLEEV